MRCHEEHQAVPADPQSTRGLQLAVVHYADQPDRCTVSPPPAVECDRMTTWLSVNREVLVSTESMR